MESPIATSQIGDKLSVWCGARKGARAAARLKGESVELAVPVEVSGHQQIAVCGGKRGGLVENVVGPVSPAERRGKKVRRVTLSGDRWKE